MHKDFKLPHKKQADLFLLNLFTRLTAIGACRHLALSFRSMKDDKRQKIRVVPPLLRRSIFQQEPKEGDYIHGYMVNSGFSEYVLKWHKANPATPLRFFWDRWDEPEVKKIDDTLSFYQLDDTEFLKQMAGCKAYASTAGFESVCEAMYLGKPLMMVPAHIEQECNAYDAMQSGAGISDDSFNLTDCCSLPRPTVRPRLQELGRICREHHRKRTGKSGSRSLCFEHVPGRRICVSLFLLSNILLIFVYTI